MSLVSPHPGGARFKHAFYTAGQQCTRRESGDVKWKYKINSFVDLTKKIDGGVGNKTDFLFFLSCCLFWGINSTSVPSNSTRDERSTLGAVSNLSLLPIMPRATGPP